MRSRRRALSASLSGARHGLVPMRKGQLGHPTAVHLRTSSLEPPQQSRQCARITAVGAIGACPSSRSSSGPILRGSRPIRRPSDSASVPSAILASLLMRAPPACCQAKSRPSVPSRSRGLAFLVGAGGLEPGRADERPSALAGGERIPQARSRLNAGLLPGAGLPPTRFFAHIGPLRITPVIGAGPPKFKVGTK
jgi:hypothetical protein